MNSVPMIMVLVFRFGPLVRLRSPALHPAQLQAGVEKGTSNQELRDDLWVF